MRRKAVRKGLQVGDLMCLLNAGLGLISEALRGREVVAGKKEWAKNENAEDCGVDGAGSCAWILVGDACAAGERVAGTGSCDGVGARSEDECGVLREGDGIEADSGAI